MGALLLFNALAIICAFQDYVDVKKTGTSHGWDVAFDNFQFFKDILAFHCHCPHRQWMVLVETLHTRAR